LVGGLRLSAGEMYLVEEPEIHLHPRAQAELGDFFLHLYDAGVWSVVETHSEYLLLRLQQHVAEGHIPASDVLFYYVSATKTGKRIAPMELDRLGRFHEPIPGGFFPERLEEAKRLAKLRGQHAIGRE
jgi:predicted ATPase